MKISIDGGALSADKKSRFGTFVFSSNLIQALNLYDRKNRYVIYSLDDRPAFLKLNKNLIYKKLMPKKLWMPLRVSLEEQLNKQSVFLALNQAAPITTARIFAFSHGLSFYFHRNLYPDSHSIMMRQLDVINRKADTIIVSSVKVKNELKKIFKIRTEIIVIPFGIPFDRLIYTKRKRKKYFLYVGMNHPIKNIGFLESALKELKKTKEFSDYKLIKIEKSTISRVRLNRYYQEATAYLSASLYESFNLPVLEALSQNCPVIGLSSAIIPELKPYVNMALSHNDFVVLMKKAAHGDLESVDRKKLFERFSWREYVAKLTSLY